MNIRVTLYQSNTYFVESDNEEQALAYVKANPKLVISEHETWTETEEVTWAVTNSFAFTKSPELKDATKHPYANGG